jgi:hypothetical protein
MYVENMGDIEEAYKIFVETPESKRPGRRHG